MKLSRRQWLATATAGLAAFAGSGARRAFGQAALGDTTVRFGKGSETAPSVAGIDSDRLDDLANLFEQQIRDGLHPGAQLTVMVGDHVVFDRWGGFAIKPTTRMRRDTKMLLFSSTKPLGAALTMMLIEDGYLDLDVPVVHYWPAFDDGDEGKNAVTVRHILGHQAGFPHGPDYFNYENFNDPAAAMRAMERVELAWEPGSRFEYHPINYGWVLGELIRRTSGMPVERFARERLFTPLGCINASIGVPADELDEIAFIYRVDNRDHTIEIWNSPTVRMAPCVAASGHMPACDLVRFYNMMRRGGVTPAGVRLLSERSVTLMTERGAVEKTDESSPYGLGFFIRESAEGKESTKTFGHGGSGTSFGRCEPALGLSVAFIANGHRGGETHEKRMADIWDACRGLCAGRMAKV